MNIIIPLGGKGERFKSVGYNESKPLIKMFGKPMILYVLDNLKISNEDAGPRLIQIFDQEDLDEAMADGHPQNVLDDWMYANSIHLVDLFRVFARGKILSIKK
jgi:molybdopterin-guanine dinucleotide biosynthesis protein A